MKLSEIKDHYFFQLHQKNDIQSALQLPTTLVILLVGVLIVYSKYLKFRVGILEAMFLLSTIAVGLGCFFLIRVLSMYKYEEIADIKAFLKYKEELDRYFQKHTDAEGNPDGDFERDLTFKYAEAVDTNAEMNRKRFSDIYWANRAIIIAGILIALTLYPYLKEKDQDTERNCQKSSTEVQRSNSDG